MINLEEIELEELLEESRQARLMLREGLKILEEENND